MFPVSSSMSRPVRGRLPGVCLQQVTSPLAILPSPPPCVCTPPLSLRLHLIYLSPGLHRLPVSTPHPVRLRSRLISLPASLCSHLTLAASSLSLRFHSFSSIPGVPPPPPPPPDPACHCGRCDGAAVCQPQALCGVCEACGRQCAQQCDRGGGRPCAPVCGRGVCDQGQVHEADPLHGQVGPAPGWLG